MPLTWNACEILASEHSFPKLAGKKKQRKMQQFVAKQSEIYYILKVSR